MEKECINCIKKGIALHNHMATANQCPQRRNRLPQQKNFYLNKLDDNKPDVQSTSIPQAVIQRLQPKYDKVRICNIGIVRLKEVTHDHKSNSSVKICALYFRIQTHPMC